MVARVESLSDSITTYLNGIYVRNREIGSGKRAYLIGDREYEGETPVGQEHDQLVLRISDNEQAAIWTSPLYTYVSHSEKALTARTNKVVWHNETSTLQTGVAHWTNGQEVYERDYELLDTDGTSLVRVTHIPVEIPIDEYAFPLD